MIFGRVCEIMSKVISEMMSYFKLMRNIMVI